MGSFWGKIMKNEGIIIMEFQFTYEEQIQARFSDIKCSARSEKTFAWENKSYTTINEIKSKKAITAAYKMQFQN